MKILVVGGGGREHAIASALSRNTQTTVLSVMAKRKPGIDSIAGRVLLTKETDVPRIVSFARENGVDFAFIGPEAPLEAGIVDNLETAGIPSIGPVKAAARIETDKAFCREMMERNAIEDARNTGSSIPFPKPKSLSRIMKGTSSSSPSG